MEISKQQCVIECGGYGAEPFDGVNYKSDMGGLSYEFGGNATSFYSDIMYETGDNVQSIIKQPRHKIYFAV